jgi:hypothetical protein
VEPGSYIAYGLTINSQLPLPELITDCGSGPGGATLTVREGQVRTPSDTARVKGYEIDIGPQTAFLYLNSVGCFEIRGSEIIYAPVPGVTAKTLGLFILGPALAMVLHRRGNLVLHASAVVLLKGVRERGAVAFLGHSRQGKSTMAAALHARGHQAVADDIVAVPGRFLLPTVGKSETDNLQISPGFPMLKLWPEALAYLGPGAESPSISLSGRGNSPRTARIVADRFSPEPIPLRRLYLLEDSESLQCQPLPQKGALLEILRHSYWVAQLPPEQNATHFRQCAALVERIPVHRLERRRDLSRIADVAQLIEEEEARFDSESHRE